MNIQKEIKRLIGLGETEDALIVLKDNTENIPAHADVLILSAQFYSLKKLNTLGTITLDEHQARLSKLNQSILSINDDIEKGRIFKRKTEGQKVSQKNTLIDSVIQDVNGDVQIGDKFIEKHVHFHANESAISSDDNGLLGKKSIDSSQLEFDEIFNPGIKNGIKKTERDELVSEAAIKFSSIGANHKKIHELVDLFVNVNDLALLRKFMEEFVLVEDSDLESSTKKIVKQLSNWKINPKKTHFLQLNDEDTPSGKFTSSVLEKLRLALIKPNSKKNILSKLFKTTNSWDNNFLVLSFLDSYHNVKSNTTVIFIIPVIYDATKIIKKLNTYNQKLIERKVNKVTIKVLCFYTMEAFRKEIESSGFDIKPIKWLNKGITDNYEDEELKDKMDSIRRIEKSISNGKTRGNLYPLGYKQSEALLAIKGIGCPISVFPIFWCNKNQRNIFNRF